MKAWIALALLTVGLFIVYGAGSILIDLIKELW